MAEHMFLMYAYSPLRLFTDFGFSQLQCSVSSRPRGFQTVCSVAPRLPFLMCSEYVQHFQVVFASRGAFVIAEPYGIHQHMKLTFRQPICLDSLRRWHAHLLLENLARGLDRDSERPCGVLENS